MTTGALPAPMVSIAAAALAASVLLGQRAPPLVAVRGTGQRRLVVGAVGGLGVLLVPAGWIAPFLVVLLTLVGARTLWRRRGERLAAESTGLRMQEACDLIAAELAAGRTGEAALDEAARAWPALRPVADASHLGGDVPEALRVLALVPGADGLRLLAGAWVVSHRTGTGLAISTRRVAESVRRDQATRRIIRGELASARSTARLVAVLPVAALLMGSGAGADPWTFLLRTPGGIACLAAGLAIGFVGLWWIELIAREVDA